MHVDMRILFELTISSVFHIIICSLMPVVIGTDNAVRFASQRESDYYWRSSDLNIEYV
jgi:hypothetical protein